MKLQKKTLRVGLEKPLKVLLVADTHLTLADERDDERKRALARSRTASFGNEDGHVERALDEAIAYARENCDLLVHAGDLIDFVSRANVEKARKILSDPGIFFASGNHEFSRYVGEACEDRAYKMNAYMEMGYGLGVDMFFQARVVGGVNFVAVDNSYYLFEDWQLRRLRMEIEKGYPVILCLHTPLFEESLYQWMMERGETCAYLAGCDEEHLLPYGEYRAVQQRPDGATMRMIEAIESEKAIRAILAGHLHHAFESVLPGGAVQYVAGAGYREEATELLIL